MNNKKLPQRTGTAPIFMEDDVFKTIIPLVKNKERNSGSEKQRFCKGLVEKVGPAKGGHWKVVDESIL